METIKIKFADKTIEFEEFYFNGEGMAQDTLNTYAYYPDMLETFYSDELDGFGVLNTLECRKLSLGLIERFANENGLNPSDAFDICFNGFNSEEYQKWAFGPESEYDLIEANIRRWQDASREAGRPTLFGEPMRQTAIYLPEHMITWLKAQPGTMSEAVRELIQKAMEMNGD